MMLFIVALLTNCLFNTTCLSVIIIVVCCVLWPAIKNIQIASLSKENELMAIFFGLISTDSYACEVPLYLDGRLPT